MSEIKFARGKSETLDTLPVADGQLILIEDIPEWLFDTADENGDLHRIRVRDQKTIDLLNVYIKENKEEMKKLKELKLSQIPVNPETEPTEIGSIWISTK